MCEIQYKGGSKNLLKREDEGYLAAKVDTKGNKNNETNKPPKHC